MAFSMSSIHSPPLLTRSLVRSTICTHPFGIDGHDVAGRTSRHGELVRLRRVVEIAAGDERPAHLQLAHRPSVPGDLARLVHRADVHPRYRGALHARGQTVTGSLVSSSSARPQTAHRRHLGHAPGVHDPQPVLLLVALDHAWGAAAPPTIMARRLSGPTAVLVERLSIPSHTVDTPAVSVTRSSEIRPRSGAGSSAGREDQFCADQVEA